LLEDAVPLELVVELNSIPLLVDRTIVTILPIEEESDERAKELTE
jgi:hypothetical protein